MKRSRIYYLNAAACVLLCMPGGAVMANGILPASYPGAQLINAGRRIFFEETFNGNGRTCGSCHPADNNYTLDPQYISTLPADDPLFVAERHHGRHGRNNPLAENFEKPGLMRKLGLILENTNGFDELQDGYTLRSVPHLLAMRTSLQAPSAEAADGTQSPPVERTGWSGDGAPLEGRLKDFLTGAIRQHLTRTLNRRPGVDFRLPTDYEIAAVEAFMLSLGRQREYDDFRQIRMRNEKAERGRLNYLGEGLASGIPCNACHFNGGANTDPDFAFPADITSPAYESSNRSFAPRVEELLDQPGDVISGEPMPFDDGFGQGTNLFNAPTVIEAADTAPFFHANQVDTVEAMVSFYATQRHLRNGEVLPPIVGLNGSQVANVAAFLRVLNADENARSAIVLLQQAKDCDNAGCRRENKRLARAEINDALMVLQAASLHYDDVVPLLQKALRQLKRRHGIARAKTGLEQARALMIVRPS